MKRHRTDGVSLTFGLIFLGIVVVWLFNQAISVHLNAGWIVAVGLILFGVLGLIGALRSDKGESRAEPVSSPFNSPVSSPVGGAAVGPGGKDPNDYDLDRDLD